MLLSFNIQRYSMNFKLLKIFIFILIGVFIYIYFFLFNKNSSDDSVIKIQYGSKLSQQFSKPNDYCTFYKCLNVYVVHQYDFLFSITPKIQFIFNNKSAISDAYEFIVLKNALHDNHKYSISKNSSFIIPDIDLLYANEHFSSILIALYEKLRWDDNKNVLIFNFICNEEQMKFIHNNNFKLVLASASLYHPYYRSDVDVSIPFFNPFIIGQSKAKPINNRRIYSLYIMQKSASVLYPNLIENLIKNSNNIKIIVRQQCSETSKKFCIKLIETGKLKSEIVINDYYEQDSIFCLIFNIGISMGFHFFNAISKNCIPVVFSDKYVLPFSEVLDWNRCAIILRHYQIENASMILSTISPETVTHHQHHCSFLFTKYMSSLNKIVDTTLLIIESRFFPNRAKSYFWWNEPDYDKIKSANEHIEEIISNKIDPISFAKDIGFTAIIYNDYNCARKSERLLFDLSLDYLIKSTALVHLIFVTRTNCNIDKDKLQMYRWTIIQLSEQELRTPMRFSHLLHIETNAVLILHWHALSNLVSTDDINYGFKVWLSDKHQIVGLKLSECLFSNHVSKYPVGGMFLDIAILQKYSNYWIAVLNGTAVRSESCCNQDLMISQFYHTVFISQTNTAESLKTSCF